MIAAVENAVLARLVSAGTSGILGYEWKTAESSPYAWDDLFTDTIASVRCPAVWTGFTGFQSADMSETGLLHVTGATFALVVAAKNIRNEKSTRHGVESQGEVGSYQLLMDAIGLLSRNDLGLAIQPLRFGAAREVSRTPAMMKQRLSVFAVEYRTDLWLSPADLAQNDAAIAPFEDFTVAWDVPPLGNVQPPLPAEEADARDLNSLPQEENQ